MPVTVFGLMRQTIREMPGAIGQLDDMVKASSARYAWDLRAAKEALPDTMSMREFNKHYRRAAAAGNSFENHLGKGDSIKLSGLARKMADELEMIDPGNRNLEWIRKEAATLATGAGQDSGVATTQSMSHDLNYFRSGGSPDEGVFLLNRNHREKVAARVTAAAAISGSAALIAGGIALTNRT